MNDINLPLFLHIAYYGNMVVMPQCKCQVIVRGRAAKLANLLFDTSRKIGFIQDIYSKTAFKKGCYANILELESIEGGGTILTVEGVSRFVSHQDVPISGYDHECVIVDYAPYEDDLTAKNKYVELKDIQDIFAKYFLSICDGLGIGSLEGMFDVIPIHKLLNSLIMITPMPHSQRVYLSELENSDQMEQALSVILEQDELNLTAGASFH